jgi:AbrB family looped-hinge helix DNA binding protein
MVIVEGTVTIDRAGRVVIPKMIRDELRLEPGDTLALAIEGDSVTLRPLHANAPLQKERGVWVFRANKPLSLEEANRLVRDGRAQRDRRNLGMSER